MSEGRSDLEKQSLGVILAMLGVMIVGLVVIIAVMSSIMNVKTREELEEGLVLFGENTEPTDCRDIDKLESTVDINNCLFHEYRSGKSSEAEEAYERMINSMLEAGDYDRMLELITGRSSMYFLIDQCDKSLESLRDERVSVLSDEQKQRFYESAIDLSANCGDEVGKEQYVSLKRQGTVDE